ncbi:hypothetical protein [Xylanimonas ulmi]|uniref:Uncharacterized protein n=1 Tax=Xylanimonas ulmi TaxID=228973 RepID=A0A4Q7M077_9MICO|nr:hypothetical protein [Xylanibacterium ulmi]RZS60263.1 hypothetical protein EV386_0515 [Xylanibacterium ulmi]
MDPIVMSLIRQAEDEALRRHLEQVRMAREIRAERRQHAAANGIPTRTAPGLRDRLHGLLHPRRHSTRLA